MRNECFPNYVVVFGSGTCFFHPAPVCQVQRGITVNKQRTDVSMRPNIYRLIGSQEPDCRSYF